MTETTKQTVRRAARTLRKQAMAGRAGEPQAADAAHKIASLLDAITAHKTNYAVEAAARHAALAILGEETPADEQQPDPA